MSVTPPIPVFQRQLSLYSLLATPAHIGGDAVEHTNKTQGFRQRHHELNGQETAGQIPHTTNDDRNNKYGFIDRERCRKRSAYVKPQKWRQTSRSE